VTKHPPAARPPDGDGQAARRDRSKSRLDEVFGDVLPATTRDDLDDAEPTRRTADATRDEELRRDVPPHHH
jgi:hypothetical protein